MFFSEQDYLTTSTQARTGMPIFADENYNWYAVCGDTTLNTAHWICRKQGHARGALAVLKNSDTTGRHGVTKAMMTVSGISGSFSSFLTDLECAQDATWLGDGCTYNEEATCPFGDETIVECDTGKIGKLPATSIIAVYGDSAQAVPSKQGTVVVQMGDFDPRTGDFTRMTLGYFCAADVKIQNTADKICKIISSGHSTHAVQWTSAGKVTNPDMRITRRIMDSLALRPIKLGPCESVETCGLKEDWNLCTLEESLSIMCE